MWSMDHTLKHHGLHIHVCDTPQVEQTLILKEEFGCLCGMVSIVLNMSSPKENTSHIKCDELYFQNKVNPFQKSLIHSKIASSHSYFNINKFVKLFNFIAVRDTSEIESSSCTFLSER